MDDIREKYNSGEAQAREAFEELCAMVDALAVSMIVLNMLVDIPRYEVHTYEHFLILYSFPNHSPKEKNEERLLE